MKRVAPLLAMALAACASLPETSADGGRAGAEVRVRWAGRSPGLRMEVANRACESRASAGVRQRIVTAAASQWARFRYPLIDRASARTSLIPTDAGDPIVAAELNPPAPPNARARVALRLGAMDDDRDVRLAIGAYWAVTDAGEIAKQNAIWARNRRAGWAEAWSAAFVSWVMCEAGLSDDAFNRSSAHIDYISEAYVHGREAAKAYRYEDNGEGAIDIGDLICAWRGVSAPLDYATGRARLAQAQSLHRPSSAEEEIADGSAVARPTGTHCDIVVRVNRERRRIYAIGGNVTQAVSMSIVGFSETDGRMRLETPPEFPGAPAWFAVLRLKPNDAGEASLDAAFQVNPIS
jgi:hypothetical protein